MAYLKGTPNDKHTIKHSVLTKMFGRKPKTTDTESKSEKLSQTFKFRLSSETKSTLRHLSSVTGKSQSTLMREGIVALSKSASGAKELYVGNRLYRVVKSLTATKVG